MKSLFRSFIMAFSGYSISPKSKLARNKENCSYILMFIPLVGAIITIIINRWAVLYPYMCENPIFPAIVGAVVPTILSAGVHMDGFFKTVDAISANKDREGALAILKDDAHGGYSSIIVGICYFMVAFGIWSEMPIDGIFVIAFAYVISRALYAISILTVNHAQADKSMCYVPENSAAKWIQVAANVAYLVVCAVLMVQISLTFESSNMRVAIFPIVAALITFVYYIVMSKKRFGGVTEELGGYFVMLCEVIIPIAAIVAYKSPI